MFEWTKELERKVRNILKEPITEKDKKEFTKHLLEIAEEKDEKIEGIDFAIQADRVSKAIGVPYKEALVKIAKINEINVLIKRIWGNIRLNRSKHKNFPSPEDLRIDPELAEEFRKNRLKEQVEKALQGEK